MLDMNINLCIVKTPQEADRWIIIPNISIYQFFSFSNCITPIRFTENRCGKLKRSEIIFITTAVVHPGAEYPKCTNTIEKKQHTIRRVFLFAFNDVLYFPLWHWHCNEWHPWCRLHAVKTINQQIIRLSKRAHSKMVSD